MILNENQGECYGLYENHCGFLAHKNGEYYVSSYYYDEHVQLRSHGVVKNPKWRQENPRQQLAVVTQSLFGHLRNFVEGRIDADMLKDRLQGNNEMEEISALIKMMPDGEWYE